uniref:Uncharacterized protein n=1 Tax=Arundo donax TaxID=35708 RepID=A0A0A9ATH2_ARUDO
MAEMDATKMRSPMTTGIVGDKDQWFFGGYTGASALDLDPIARGHGVREVIEQDVVCRLLMVEPQTLVAKRNDDEALIYRANPYPVLEPCSSKS